MAEMEFIWCVRISRHPKQTHSLCWDETKHAAQTFRICQNEGEREKKQVVNDEKIGWRLIAAIKACDSFCSHFWFAENNVFVKMITSRVLKKRVLKNCWQNNCHLFWVFFCSNSFGNGICLTFFLRQKNCLCKTTTRKCQIFLRFSILLSVKVLVCAAIFLPFSDERSLETWMDSQTANEMKQFLLYIHECFNIVRTLWIQVIAKYRTL